MTVRFRIPIPTGVAGGMTRVLMAATMTAVLAPAAQAQEDSALARLARKELGQCMVRNAPDVARALLVHSDSGKVDFDRMGLKPAKLSTALHMGDCIAAIRDDDVAEQVVEVSTNQLRHLLAEELYLTENAAMPASLKGGDESVARNFLSTGEPLAAARAYADLADCITFKSPDVADALLRTKPGTSEEQALTNRLKPTIGACMPDRKDVTMSFSIVRDLVADGLWARAHYGNAMASAKD